MLYGIPVFGTMAHSYVMFFDTEIEAFRTFAEAFPNTSTFLIDTYDNLKGAENAAKVAKEMEKKGHRLRAVRLDSGDLVTISKSVREILDKDGLNYVQIFASGDLDEYKVESLIRRGAKIDAFGVGTRMSTSNDRPYVDVVYKLSGKVEQDTFMPAMKLSTGKITLPGRKQVFRLKDSKGRSVRDTIGLEGERVEGEPLLEKVMEKGRLTRDLPSLEEARSCARRNLSELPDRYKKLRNAPRYPVRLSPRLGKIKRELARHLREL
jgi:nicotinate phosphoribosyltransferase